MGDAMTNTNGKIVEIDLDTQTLLADVRDAILSEFKAVDKPWEKQNEKEQGRLIQRAEYVAGRLIADAVAIVADRGFSSMPAAIDQFTRKDGIKITLKASATVEHITQLAEHGMNAVVLVLAEPSKFMGKAKPTEPDNVGDLAMPKTGPGAPSDEAAMAKLGRGNAAH